MPIYVLYGADELLRARRLQELKEEVDGGSGMLSTNLTSVEGRDAKPADIINAAMVAPFLAPKRMVLVEGLIDRYQGSRRKGFGAMDALFEKLEAGIPETTVIVFTGGDRDRWGNTPFGSNPFVERLKAVPGVMVETFDEIKPRDMARFVKEEAAARGIRFRTGRSERPFPPGEEWLRPKETDPAALLAALHPGDTMGIAKELEKLAVYAMGREVTVDDVDLLCAGERSFAQFDFTDAIMDGDLVKAFGALEYLKRHGKERGELLFQIRNAYRQVAIAGDMLGQGAAPEEIGRALRIRHPFPRDKAINRSRKLGPAGVRAAFEAMVEADRTNKLGEVDEDAGMHILINRLCALAR